MQYCKGSVGSEPLFSDLTILLIFIYRYSLLPNAFGHATLMNISAKAILSGLTVSSGG